MGDRSAEISVDFFVRVADLAAQCRYSTKVFYKEQEARRCVDRVMVLW